MVETLASLLMYFNKLASVSIMQFSAINDFFSEKISKLFYRLRPGEVKGERLGKGERRGAADQAPPPAPVPVPEGSQGGDG